MLTGQKGLLLWPDTGALGCLSVPPTHQLDNPGDAGDSSCIKRRFDLAPRSWMEFEGTRYYNGEAALAAIRFIEYHLIPL